MELHEIVFKLLGPIGATGDHGRDMDRVGNINKLGEMLLIITDELGSNVKCANDPRMGVREVGNVSKSILTEMKVTIDELLGEE